MDQLKGFAAFILQHVAKILVFTQDFFAMSIVLHISDWLAGKTEAEG